MDEISYLRLEGGMLISGNHEKIKSSNKKFWGYSVAGFGLWIIIYAFVFPLFRPARTAETLVILFFISIVVLTPIYFSLRKSLESVWMPTQILGAIDLVLTASTALLLANGVLDKSSSVETKLPIEKKEISYGRGGYEHFFVLTENPVSNCILLCFDFDQLLNIPVKAYEFERAEIGKTKIAIEIKHGFFGFPWIAETAVW